MLQKNFFIFKKNLISKKFGPLFKISLPEKVVEQKKRSSNFFNPKTYQLTNFPVWILCHLPSAEVVPPLPLGAGGARPSQNHMTLSASAQSRGGTSSEQGGHGPPDPPDATGLIKCDMLAVRESQINLRCSRLTDKAP